jgi:hypothetical protein
MRLKNHLENSKDHSDRNYHMQRNKENPLPSLTNQKSTLWSSTASPAKTTPLVTDSWVEGARPDVVKDQTSDNMESEAKPNTTNDSKLVTESWVEGARPDISRGP